MGHSEGERGEPIQDPFEDLRKAAIREQSIKESNKIRYQLYFLCSLFLCGIGILLGIAIIYPDVSMYPV